MVVVTAVVLLGMLAALVAQNAGVKTEALKPSTTTTTLKAPKTSTSVPAATAVVDDASARAGDVVEVNYIIQDLNGTIYDTSFEELAPESLAYDPEAKYAPIKFTVGNEEALLAMDEGVVGMRVGEERFLEAPPTKAFGIRSQELVHVVSRTEIIPRLQNVSPDAFAAGIGGRPVAGAVYNVSKENSTIIWPVTVLSVSENSVRFRYEVPAASLVSTYFGPAVIRATGDEIRIVVSPEPGPVVTKYGVAKITDVNEENFTLDFNHELADKTLHIMIQLSNITRGGPSAESAGEYESRPPYGPTPDVQPAEGPDF